MINVEITARGAVSEAAKDAARTKIGRLDRFVKGPLLGARVVLVQERNPRIELPARAEGEINLAGRPIRARVQAFAMEAAVDELAEHLQRQLRRDVDRMITRQRVASTSPAGEWRHGSRPGVAAGPDPRVHVEPPRLPWLVGCLPTTRNGGDACAP